MAGFLAVVGCVLIAVGAGMVYVPAGLVAAGVLAVVAAYVIRYFEASEERNT